MVSFEKNSIYLIGALTSKPYAFTARSWELERVDFYDFYDSFLSPISLDLRGLSVMRVLPRINEDVSEEWISDKIRFSYDGFRRQRLLVPYYRRESNFKEVSWEESFFYFFLNYNLFAYDYINSQSLEVLIGKFVDVESLVSMKLFFENFKDSSIKISYFKKLASRDLYPSDYSFNYPLKEMQSLDLCVLLGVNLRYESPLLHLKLVRLANRGLTVFSFMSNGNSKIKSVSLGNSFKDLLFFLNGNSKYSILMSRMEKKLVLLGESLKLFNNEMSIQNIVNQFSLRGFYISHLMQNVSYSSFLNLGFQTQNFFEKTLSNNFLYLYDVDDIVLKKKNSFVVYQGHHGDYGSSVANLILPSTFLLEKKGSFFNNESTELVKYRFVLNPGDKVRTDWRIFSGLAAFFSFDNYDIYDYGSLIKRCQNYITYYNGECNHLLLESMNFKEISSRKYNNNIGFSMYIDYFLNDSVTRASKVMALSALRFKNNFINFVKN